MSRKMRFDALVVGGGIAGMQAALDLADQWTWPIRISRWP
jgi:heterodisulfide reductase subunit A-like polyferredoxin